MARLKQQGNMGLIPKRTSVSQPKPDISDIPDDIDELKTRCGALELKGADVLEMLDALKVNPCASTADLSNTEKTLIADGLKDNLGAADASWKTFSEAQHLLPCQGMSC